LSKNTETIRAWAEDNFGAAHLSDIRRIDRVVTIGEAMAVNAGKSIPQLFASPYDVKAAYNLFKNEEATLENIQAGHREKVRLTMTSKGIYLLIEDTTTMSWSGNEAIPGLGPIGNGKSGLQGFLMHSVIGVRWAPEIFNQAVEKRPPVEILGIVHQKYFVRQTGITHHGTETNWFRKQRARESTKWLESVTELGEAAAGVRYVHIGDREADIYEYLWACYEQGHGYVVRAVQNRALVNEAGGTKEYLFEKAEKSLPLGSFDLRLRSRGGQGARTARLKVSATRVVLSPPKNSKGTQPLECCLLRVWEEKAPEAVEALEWKLLTDLRVETFDQALECVLQYATRWIIEEYHKALKTGMKAEDLQLEKADRLFAAIAIKSIVALRLIDLKEQVRIKETQPAEESGLTELELKVLRKTSAKPLTTVKEAALQIGRLGGHMNRKADGMPGWITLWRGMEKLRLIVEGVRMAQDLN